MFHVSCVELKLPGICINQPINYTFIIEKAEAYEEGDTSIMEGPHYHEGPGLITHQCTISGLKKDQNYSIKVLVNSISGSSQSQEHYFGENYAEFN